MRSSFDPRFVCRLSHRLHGPPCVTLSGVCLTVGDDAVVGCDQAPAVAVAGLVDNKAGLSHSDSPRLRICRSCSLHCSSETLRALAASTTSATVRPCSSATGHGRVSSAGGVMYLGTVTC